MIRKRLEKLERAIFYHKKEVCIVHMLHDTDTASISSLGFKGTIRECEKFMDEHNNYIYYILFMPEPPGRRDLAKDLEEMRAAGISVDPDDFEAGISNVQEDI